jgi:hypothetical protein
MKITIDREARNEKEGIALTVYVNGQGEGEEKYWQFKIDVWSKKDTGIYRMRLDGFHYLKNIPYDTLPALLEDLASIDSRNVLAEGKVIEEEFRKLIPERKEIPDSTILKFFEMARDVVLNELAPLVGSGNN